MHPDAVTLEEAVWQVETEREREPVLVKVPLGVREVDLVMVPEPHWLTEAVELTHRVGLTLLLNVAALLVATGVSLGLVLRDTVNEGEGLVVRVKGFEDITAVMVTLVHPDEVKLEEAVWEVDTEREREPELVKVPLGVREGDVVVDIVTVLDLVKGKEVAKGVGVRVEHAQGEGEEEVEVVVESVVERVFVPLPHELTEGDELTHNVGDTDPVKVDAMEVANGVMEVVPQAVTVSDMVGEMVGVTGFEDGMGDRVVVTVNEVVTVTEGVRVTDVQPEVLWVGESVVLAVKDPDPD